MSWLLAAVVAALTGHTAINATRWLRRLSPGSAGTVPPTVAEPVAVLLPLRDEADRVVPCLRALLAQRGVPGLAIVVLDDGSTDGTAEVVRRVVGGDPRVTLLTGDPPPAGWLGKPHACHQLAAHVIAARSDRPDNGTPAGPTNAGPTNAGPTNAGPTNAGPTNAGPTATGPAALVFVDADVLLHPDAVAVAVSALRNTGATLLSPYPRIVAGTVGERLVQPLLQWSWLTFLPLRAVERSRRPALAAAGGQFLVLDRAGYQRAGGHAAVRDRVLEDIELARSVKRAGGRVVLADASALARCRMYTSWAQLRDGYGKSLWASFGSPLAAGSVLLLLLLLYATPPLLALAALVRGELTVALAAGTAYLLGVVGRVLAARATGGRWWPDALAHPLSVVLLGWLTARSYHLRRRRRLSWRGRPVP